jgi:hypothetical protein
MLIGNRWVEKTRLKFLNSDLILGAAWGDYPGDLTTNLSEVGFLVGFTSYPRGTQMTLLEFQILFDGQPQHEGFIRGMWDVGMSSSANQQPMTNAMPHIDIPENTVVTMRGRIANGALGFVNYIDLYAVVYYVKDWEAALPAVCFPTDVVPPDQV